MHSYVKLVSILFTFLSTYRQKLYVMCLLYGNQTALLPAPVFPF